MSICVSLLNLGSWNLLNLKISFLFIYSTVLLRPLLPLSRLFLIHFNFTFKPKNSSTSSSHIMRDVKKRVWKRKFTETVFSLWDCKKLHHVSSRQNHPSFRRGKCLTRHHFSDYLRDIRCRGFARCFHLAPVSPLKSVGPRMWSAREIL